MKLVSSRSLNELKEVLIDPNSDGPDPVYEVFTELGNQWVNQTVIKPGCLGKEFTKTYGHYHSVQVNETYHLVSGKGVLIMQKRDLSKIFLIRVNPGEEILITPEWGHSWSNIGGTELITYDDWRQGHIDSDYEEIRKMHGMAYYLVQDGDQVKEIPNSNYQNLPEPKWVSVEEFNKLNFQV